MRKALLSLMAISLIAVGCFSSAQEKDWIEYSGSDIIVYSPDNSYGIVIQDRNLGATMTGAGKNAPKESYGNFYQWGNNYGFPSDPNITIAITGTKVDASTYGPNNPYSSSTFIKGVEGHNNWESDWSSVRNDNLRGGEGDDDTNGWGLNSKNPITGRQGPCPQGYHVPSIGELDELTIMWYNNKYDDNLPTGYVIEEVNSLYKEDVNIYLAFIEDLLMPLTSYRDGRGEVDDDYIDILGNIRSSSSYSYMGFTLSLTLIPREIYVDPGYYRSSAIPIRCFSDERVYPEISNILTFNVLSGDNVVSTGINFTNEPLTSGQVLGAIEWLASEVELSTGYHFAWYTETGGVETGFDLDTAVSEGTITSSIALTGKIEPNKYIISFLDENGAEIMSGEFTYDQEANLPANTSTKEGYTFKGWKDSEGNTYDDGASIKNLTTEDGAILEFSPIREENPKPSGSSSGGGGGGGGSKPTDSQTDIDKTTNTEKSDDDSNTTPEEDNSEDLDGLEVVNYNPDLPDNQQTLSDGLTPEMHEAYKWAYKNGITTKPTILEADMYGLLDRISMAKMLSTYAIKILGMTPDTSRINQFADVTPEMDAEFNNGVTLAYQLGIMGINMYNNEFRPFDLVPRSEFGTALSRMLYQLSDGEYEKTDEFYTLHFEKLKEEGIMTVLDPTIEELRGYVMIMLMRAAKK